MPMWQEWEDEMGSQGVSKVWYGICEYIRQQRMKKL